MKKLLALLLLSPLVVGDEDIFLECDVSFKRDKYGVNTNLTNQTAFIEISGKAKNEQLIAEYINNLQDIPYYKLTFLHKSTQTIMGGYPIYSFTAYSYMPKKIKKK